MELEAVGVFKIDDDAYDDADGADDADDDVHDNDASVGEEDGVHI